MAIKIYYINKRQPIIELKCRWGGQLPYRFSGQNIWLFIWPFKKAFIRVLKSLTQMYNSGTSAVVSACSLLKPAAAQTQPRKHRRAHRLTHTCTRFAFSCLLAIFIPESCFLRCVSTRRQDSKGDVMFHWRGMPQEVDYPPQQPGGGLYLCGIMSLPVWTLNNNTCQPISGTISFQFWPGGVGSRARSKISSCGLRGQPWAIGTSRVCSLCWQGHLWWWHIFSEGIENLKAVCGSKKLQWQLELFWQVIRVCILSTFRDMFTGEAEAFFLAAY